MARNLRSRRESDIESGVVPPPAENESVMLKIRTFLMDKGRVENFVFRAFRFILCVWGFITLPYKGLEYVAPDAFLRQETKRIFWWAYFSINLPGFLVVVVYLIHFCLPKRDQYTRTP